MIKGPIGLLLVSLTIIGLWIWEKDLAWAKPLINIGAILLFLLIWVPWVIAIYHVTDGAFFAESLGKDLGGKVVGAQENHGAPPGAHLGVIALTLWPASLFILPGLVYSFITLRHDPKSDIARSIRLCVTWALPFWIIIELMPTKLPHYALPIFPALCVIMGLAVLAMQASQRFVISRRINAVLFVFTSAILIVGIFLVQSEYGHPNHDNITKAILLISACLALTAAFLLFFGRIKHAFLASLLCGAILSGGTYSYILPKLESFRTSERLAQAIRNFDPLIKASQIHSPHYTEPSFVYHLGKDINLKSGDISLVNRPVLILDTKRDSILLDSREMAKATENAGMCLKTSKALEGFNYSKGDEVSLVILQAVPCQAPEL